MGKFNLLPDRYGTVLEIGIGTGIGIFHILRFHSRRFSVALGFGFALVLELHFLGVFLLQIALLVFLLELVLAGLLRRLL